MQKPISPRSRGSSKRSANDKPADSGSAPTRLTAARVAGLEWLGSAVVVLDSKGRCQYLNPAACELFGISQRSATRQKFAELFLDGRVILRLVDQARRHAFDEQGEDITLQRLGQDDPLILRCLAVRLMDLPDSLLLEFQPEGERDRAGRGERQLGIVRSSRELLRNMAHEIRNPLGGIRGAAQLLEHELPSADLREYTGVIIREVDRLQQLVDRLLQPHQRAVRLGPVNIHEVCEQVRSIVLAEFPSGLTIERDYDTSLPDLDGDAGQLVQGLLNLVRNAAQALEGRGHIRLRTRVARQVVIGGVRHRLALNLYVIDQGPGIPAELIDRIFFPLVTGREGGSGLGLALAQTFIERHGGLIECQSRPGWTEFRVLLPITRHTGPSYPTGASRT